MHPTNTYLLVLCLLFLLLTSTVSSAAAASAALHRLLEAHGLPAGLFPDTVKSYSLDDSSGRLEVELYGPCMAKFENRVLFEMRIQANLSYGKLKGLVGISQEELFLWLPVKDIIVRDPSSGLILFDIGVAVKQISLSLFEDPPVCEPQDKNKEEKEKGYLSSETRETRDLF